MVKALFKKQLAELLSAFTRNKNGKRKGLGAMAVLLVLFVFLFLAMFSMFSFFLAFFFKESGGSWWIYFAVMAFAATVFGVFGSVAVTYATLYSAKDNELLLSMPVPPSLILFVRMSALYVVTFVCEATVMLPSFVCYWIATGGVGALSAVAGIISLVLLPLAALFLSCLLGWIVALIAPFVKYKGPVLMIVYVVFFGLYFFVYIRLSDILRLIVENAASVGAWLKAWAYPFYCLGMGATDNFALIAVFAAIVLGAFALVYLVLSLTFIRFATAKRQGKKARFHGERIKSRPLFRALLGKEAKRFFSSSVYLVNCAFGALILLALGVALIVFRDQMAETFASDAILSRSAAVLAFGVASWTVSICPISAPSISLEGKSIWVLRSMPVETGKILAAKCLFSFLVPSAPVLFFCISAACVLPMDVPSAVLLVVCSLFDLAFCSVTGLTFGLKFPNLDYASEAVAVKQGAAMGFSLLCAFLPVMVLVLVYLPFSSLLPSSVWLGFLTLLSLAVTLFLAYRLKTEGVRRFEEL